MFGDSLLVPRLPHVFDAKLHQVSNQRGRVEFSDHDERDVIDVPPRLTTRRLNALPHLVVAGRQGLVGHV